MKLVTQIFASAFLFVSMHQFVGADIFGDWVTVNEDTGERKSIVRIYEKDGAVFGKITDLLLQPNDSVCKECKGELKDQPVVGMDIITNLKKDGKKYAGGRILDPNNGKVYDAKIWRKGDTLFVRGYIGFLYRTQEWVLAE